MTKIIAVDFDNTLTNETAWTSEDAKNATPNQEVIDYVNSLRGHFIVIYTARVDELIPESLKWLRRHNVNFDAFSNNKMAAHYYLDDKAVHSIEELKKKIDE